VNHEGVVFTCNKAYVFEKENYLKAFDGNECIYKKSAILTPI
jgi:hypothetical protein